MLQHVRSSYRSGHSCQPAVLFENDGSSSNTAASVIYNKSEDAINRPFIGMHTTACPISHRGNQAAVVYGWLQCFGAMNAKTVVRTLCSVALGSVAVGNSLA